MIYERLPSIIVTLWLHKTPSSPMANPVSVINPFYCFPHPVTLQINTEKGATYNENDDRLFYTDDTFFTLHNRRVLYDDAENPIVTLYNKMVSLHGRCKVFRGESTNPSELLFSVKKIKKSPGITKLNVFLANNQGKKKRKSDFRVIIYGSKRSCIVYAGESPNIVAKMENNGGFNVEVNPNVDYAFIVVLLMIVKDMKCSDESKEAINKTISALNIVSTSLSGS
ncbi:hypothetical protein VNO80_07453 [Phaseolus coccineus]|uniref:Protein LURP-one-related 15 n=1 Tax=Phaseolus coccineus TaxID=3886 RepID=A0AAN9RFE6_PHACN